MDSLSDYSASELTKLPELPEDTYLVIVSLQQSMTLDSAITAKTVRQTVEELGLATTTKIVCAIVKLFNDGLNTTLQMTVRQLLEYGTLWVNTYPHETIKDLVLCLRYVKMGRYGGVFNRIDSSVLGDFFVKYLGDKADRYEQLRRKELSDLKQQEPLFVELLYESSQRELKKLMTKGKALATPVITPLSSDRAYVDYLRENIKTIEQVTLDGINKRARNQGMQELIDITNAEIKRRVEVADKSYQDSLNQDSQPLTNSQ